MAIGARHRVKCALCAEAAYFKEMLAHADDYFAARQLMLFGPDQVWQSGAPLSAGLVWHTYDEG